MRRCNCLSCKVFDLLCRETDGPRNSLNIGDSLNALATAVVRLLRATPENREGFLVLVASETMREASGEPQEATVQLASVPVEGHA